MENDKLYLSWTVSQGVIENGNVAQVVKAANYKVTVNGGDAAYYSEPTKVEIASAPQAQEYTVEITAFGADTNTLKSQAASAEITLLAADSVFAELDGADGYTLTDAKGNVMQDYLVEGETYSYTATKEGHYDLTGEVTAAADAVTLSFQAIPEATSNLTVLVQDVNGQVISGASVKVYPFGEAETAAQTTQSNGATTFKDLKAGVTYSVVIEKDNYELYVNNEYSLADTDSVFIAQLVKGVFTPSIQVVDEGSAPLANASVTLNGAIYFTGVDGFVQGLPTLEQGLLYEARASLEGYNAKAGSVAQIKDGSTVTLTLEKLPEPEVPSLVTFTVVDDSGVPVVGAAVTVDGQTQVTNAAGQAVFSGIAAGVTDYSVSATQYTQAYSGNDLNGIAAGAVVTKAVTVTAKTYAITFNYFSYDGVTYSPLSGVTQVGDRTAHQRFGQRFLRVYFPRRQL